VAVPLLYAALLWLSRDALLAGTPTPLSRATSFLSADYGVNAYWWEPLEMCRKLTLSTSLGLEPPPLCACIQLTWFASLKPNSGVGDAYWGGL
jgi:hypothetical protein